jgi:hypothetical protein
MSKDLVVLRRLELGVEGLSGRKLKQYEDLELW